VSPNASGLGLSADGATLVVANNYNDSISVIDTAAGAVRYEHDLRPYFANNEGTSGGVGGTFPFGVVVKGNGTPMCRRTGSTLCGPSRTSSAPSIST
jgi:DNA-binding beta-propeller fold protein YncE